MVTPLAFLLILFYFFHKLFHHIAFGHVGAHLDPPLLITGGSKQLLPIIEHAQYIRSRAGSAAQIQGRESYDTGRILRKNGR